MADQKWKLVGREVMAVLARLAYLAAMWFGGWYLGHGVKDIAVWMLPADAPKSAQFTLFLILMIGLFVLGARFIGWAREELRGLRAAWTDQNEVPFAITAALFSICIALIGGVCGAAWIGWLS